MLKVYTWDNGGFDFGPTAGVCDRPQPDGLLYCSRAEGHGGEHQALLDSRIVAASWFDDSQRNINKLKGVDSFEPFIS